jgi:single-strand DNA-binding protein
MNVWNGIGRITRDLEVKELKGEAKILDFSIAVDRGIKDKAGNKQVDFINCQARNKTADLITKYFEKGSEIALTGTLRTDNYENKQGQKVSRTYVAVSNVTFTYGNKKKDYAADGFEPTDDYGQEIPF